MIEHKIARNDLEAMIVIFLIIIVSVSLAVLFMDKVLRQKVDYALNSNVEIIKSADIQKK